ncbi:hypothetical protein M8C21_001246 [Ambrosia artemisiifolia]|uniref:Phosphatidate cytidylyltransferase n=1 Tax=Ambrosia artemisiifolia TaxID=4212 RepID=A0AAD5CN17_AMBAR|nr:hypothetical protein M8C21_001246 [Ambrosia artemisiifolia]
MNAKLLERDLQSPKSPSTARSRHHKKSVEAFPDVMKLTASASDLLLNDQNKYKSMWVRTYSSVWMLLCFILVVYLGHLYLWGMIVIIQILMTNELFNLLRRAHEDKRLPGFRLLNWVHVVHSYTKEEDVQYAWTHMILIVVFTQSAFTAANIFEGIFWFLLPASLIAINDVAAYFFGFFFGRTPLIKLSPKKTWEGFIGASITTVISAFLLANVLGHYQWLTCPRKDLSTGWLECDPGPLFKPEIFVLPGEISQWLPWKEIGVLPVQWHALCLGLFASVIAPFGGFFASGFKRAFKIKDFGGSIPGHGGFTDRMDCQMVMAVFAYIYHQSFVIPQCYPVEILLEQISRSLTFEEQELLLAKLKEVIDGRQLEL